MTEDDRRGSFLSALVRRGKAIGASSWEIGFADDCCMQFNFSPRQRKVIDGLRAKYEDQVHFEETGEKSLAMQAQEIERRQAVRR